MSNLYSLKPRERNPVLPPFDQPEVEDPVVILYRTEDDRMACSASIGGEPDNGYYCIYRGDRQGTIAMVECVLNALKQGNPAVRLEKPAASRDYCAPQKTEWGWEFSGASNVNKRVGGQDTDE